MLRKTLSKKLSEINCISRKKAEIAIRNNKVFLNGRLESRPFVKVIDGDKIETQKENNKIINILLFHKPKGCITSKKDEKNRSIVYDYIPKKFYHFHYIGRLDYNSEGLLIFTDHTPFKRYMESPKSKIKRVYLVNVIGSLNEIKLKSLNQKVYSSITYKKPKVTLVHSNKNKHTLRFELEEGKNREIRNICEIFNLKVEKLKRISFGKYILKTIPYSKYKEIKVIYENNKR
tara:strand:- start:1770 stop:2465 length:696 start_codon:yes stop_codon:yes gene_type:complete